MIWTCFGPYIFTGVHVNVLTYFRINKKIPRGPPSPPAPVVHSPTRKVRHFPYVNFQSYDFRLLMQVLQIISRSQLKNRKNGKSLLAFQTGRTRRYVARSLLCSCYGCIEDSLCNPCSFKSPPVVPFFTRVVLYFSFCVQYVTKCEGLGPYHG